MRNRPSSSRVTAKVDVVTALDIDVDIVVRKVVQLKRDDEILELEFLLDTEGTVQFVEGAGLSIGRSRQCKQKFHGVVTDGIVNVFPKFLTSK